MTRAQYATEIVRLGDVIRAWAAVGKPAPYATQLAFTDAIYMFDLLSGRKRIPAQRTEARPITAGRNNR